MKRMKEIWKRWSRKKDGIFNRKKENVEGVKRAPWFPVRGVKVGHWTDAEALTGCTVILTPGGAVGGVDVRGSAPGTRETDLLRPGQWVERLHAILLTGGSAFGLSAASGVMKFLEEQGVGLDTGEVRVPIVPAAVLYDLAVGDPFIRPDELAGVKACVSAADEPTRGNVGAGTGATVGKVLGKDRAMKGGLGTASIALPDGLIVSAVVAVNALGHVQDPLTGEIMAGPRDDENQPTDAVGAMLFQREGKIAPIPGTHTTIGAIITNARLDKCQANRLASSAHNGLARTVAPVHTRYDGDTFFAAATGEVEASIDLVTALTAEVVEEAVIDAIDSAESIPGCPAWRDVHAGDENE